MDVTETTFAEDVIRRSYDLPVLVDFWAPWCGPCRILGPTLERLSQDAGGKFELVKVNVDDNQRLAMEYNVMGIPAVKAFRDGQVVDEFVGALPEPQVREFIKRIQPSAAAPLLQQAQALVAAGDVDSAAALFTQVLDAEPDNGQALLGMAEVLLAQERYADALQMLHSVPYTTPQFSRVSALRARIELAQDGATRPSEAEARAALAQNPQHVAAHYALGIRLAARGAYAEALEELLEVVRLNRKFENDAGRKAMLRVFEILGSEHELTQTYRSRLEWLLY
ncbi:MAG: thioredoxin [Chloroflexi bacterium]|nr:thioredoxin [Chloroflexota bacterium]